MADKQTQAKILAALKGGRRQTTVTLSALLSKRPSTVYQTLRLLEERGEVQRSGGKGGPGNPQVWYIPDGPSLREARRRDDEDLQEQEGRLEDDPEIESGIPIPSARSESRGLARAFRKMKIGQSVKIPLSSRGGQLYASAGKAGIKVITRVVDGKRNLRIWRVK